MIDSDALNPNASDSGETKQEVRADNRVAVYVKISQRAREILDAAAIPPRTRATVIEALLESLAKERDPIKERILSGESPNTLREHGELLELRSWAEHAFQNKRYVWAAGMYRILASHPSSSEGLRNICDYRLSVCLIRLSYEVRKEALERDVDKESYELALKTLDSAVNYTIQLRDRLQRHLLFPKLVLYYNLASCHSLEAQYIVESELEPGSDEIKRLLRAKNEDEKEEVWQTIGQDWRIKQEARNVDRHKASNIPGQRPRDVESEASKAFDDLQQIFPVLSHGRTVSDPELLSERIWLVDSTLKDEDFIFLRQDKQRWQAEFKNWAEAALRDRKPSFDAVSALLDELPSTKTGGSTW